MHSAQIIAFRPPALPLIGYRVDLHEFENQAIVILFQNRAIANQTPFREQADANAYARELAENHGCSVIHHNHRAVPTFSNSRTPQKSADFTRPVAPASTTPCDCLSCQTGRTDYPCLIEDEK